MSFLATGSGLVNSDYIAKLDHVLPHKHDAFLARLIPLTQVPLDVVSDGWAGLKPRRFGARSGGARAHAGGVPARIS